MNDSKKPIIIVFSVIVVAGIALAGFFYWSARYTKPDIPFTGMSTGIDQPAAKNPFSLEAKIFPSSPRAGDQVEIEAKVKSNVSPHSRAVISFFADNEKLKEISGVVPPFQSVTTVEDWQAASGRHTIRVTVSSALGEIYTSQEIPLEIK